jgi:hypothetical protein
VFELPPLVLDWPQAARIATADTTATRLIIDVSRFC